jgi:hypothetical protein
MTRFAWQDLVHCYDHVEFDDVDQCRLTVADAEILNTINALDAEDAAASDLNFYATDDLANIAIGDKVSVHVGSPKLSIGILAKDINGLLSAPRGFIEFPARFYIIQGRLSDRDTSPKTLSAYQTIVSLVRLLAEAATFMDREEQKLFFFNDGKVEIPVRYSAGTFKFVDLTAIKRLLHQFNDGLHRSQKLTILGDAITTLVKPQADANRFDLLIRNVDHLTNTLDDGYRLFVSSFSYDKIRTDVETASLDFLTRIHKTFVDVQGQLLGIPIATIVVASQMKAASTCGVEAWTNLAILAGAWIFAVFLCATIVNQFFTLNAVGSEVERQKTRLESDFAAVSAKFVGTFASLATRIGWYRFVFIVIGGLGIGGAIFATFAYRSLTAVKLAGCIW